MKRSKIGVLSGLLLLAVTMAAFSPLFWRPLPAHAQSPNDVPWAQVPEDLKQAIKSVAEEYGKPYNLEYTGSCETGVQGKLCARVITLDATTAHIGIGLSQSEAAFFDLRRTGTGWTTAPAAPGTGNTAPSAQSSRGNTPLLVVIGLAAATGAAFLGRRYRAPA